MIIGGLLKTHYSETGNQCNRPSTTDLGNAKAMIYAIERINTNFTIVPNVPIGYELRDYCWSGALVMQIAYELMRGNYPRLIKTPAFFEQLCHENKTKAISAILAPFNTGGAVLVGGPSSNFLYSRHKPHCKEHRGLVQTSKNTSPEQFHQTSAK